ncbi:hypothetical protein KAW80_02590 [Candidatus Babeliales bacterium]|nr:hypothetical protein [Candidatus Babeliales bacterium]
MSFDKTLKELEKEASLLKKSLNSSSECITSLEKMLTLQGTNFSHEFLLYSKDGNPENPVLPENSYIPSDYCPIVSFDRITMVLSWEPCEVSKRCRLFFIHYKYEELEKNEINY